MKERGQSEAGDTLLEIVVAIVVIGLVVGAYFATFSTQGTGSTAHRILVTGDGVLRSYAEATKSAVRTQCQTGSTYDVNFTPSASGYSVDAKVTSAASPGPLTSVTCPPVAQTSTWEPLELFVHMPNGQTRSLSLVVRSP